MSRCSICQGRIWPWQRFGFRTEVTGRRTWHAACATAPALATRPAAPSDAAKEPAGH